MRALLTAVVFAIACAQTNNSVAAQPVYWVVMDNWVAAENFQNQPMGTTGTSCSRIFLGKPEFYVAGNPPQNFDTYEGLYLGNGFRAFEVTNYPGYSHTISSGSSFSDYASAKLFQSRCNTEDPWPTQVDGSHVYQILN